MKKAVAIRGKGKTRPRAKRLAAGAILLIALSCCSAGQHGSPAHSFKSKIPELTKELADLRSTIESQAKLRCDQYEYELALHPTSGIRVLTRKARRSDAKPETVLNLSLLKDRFAGDNLSALRVSPNETRIAFTVGDILAVSDVSHPGVFQEGPQQAYGIEWGKDENEIFYTRMENFRIKSLRLFKPDDESDTAVFTDPHPSGSVSMKRSSDGKFILLKSGAAGTEAWHAVRTGGETPELIHIDPPEGAAIIDADHADGALFLAGHSSRRGSFLARRDSPAAPYEYLGVLEPGSFPEEIRAYGGYLAVTSRSGPSRHSAIIDLKTRRKTASFRPPLTLYSMNNEAYCPSQENAFRVSVSTPVNPPTEYEVALPSASCKVLALNRFPPESGFEPSEYRLQAVMVKSEDGAAVPMSLVLPASPPGVIVLIAYGAYGESLEASYHPELVPLLKRGAGAAYCHIRGGGEFGVAWHDAARTLKKYRSYQDVLACATALREQHPAVKLAGFARSAGAVAVARAVIERPDLFRTLVLEAPFLDVAGQMADSSLGLTPYEWKEWGDPRQPDEYRAMTRYSPFNLPEKLALPDVLVSVALKDEVIPAGEAMRWIEALKRSNTSGSTIKLETSVTASHSGEKYDYLDEQRKALQLAFILWSTGLGVNPP